jgi:hypothetical protein
VLAAMRVFKVQGLGFPGLVRRSARLFQGLGFPGLVRRSARLLRRVVCLDRDVRPKRPSNTAKTSTLNPKT